MVQTAGAYDPAAAIGVDFRFNSMSPFSGVHDPQLDKLLLQAQGSTDLSVRCGFYDQAAAYIAKNYYGPFYFAFSPANISVHGVCRARPYHAAGLRRGRADGPVGGRVLQPVGPDPESLITGGHKNYGAGSANPAPDWRIRRAR